MRPVHIGIALTLLLMERAVCPAQECDLHDLREVGTIVTQAVGLSDGSFAFAGKAGIGQPIGDLQALATCGFVVHRSATGTWDWLRTIDAGSQLNMGGLAVDEEAGHMFVCGSTWSTSIVFDGVEQEIPGDVFVARYDMSGTFEWVVRAAVHGNGTPFDVVGDGLGGVYVHGWNNPESFQAEFGPFVFPTGSANDVYLGHIRYDGTWDWVEYITGQPEAVSRNLTVDTLGRPVLVGCFNGLSLTIGQETLYADQSGEMVPPVTLFAACFETTGQLAWATTADSSVAGYSNLTMVMAREDGPLRVIGGADPGVILGDHTFDEGGYFIAGLDYTGHWTHVYDLPMVGGVMSAAPLPNGRLLVSGGSMTSGSVGPLDLEVGSALQVGLIGICDDVGHWFAADQTHGTWITDMYVATTPGEWRAVGYGSFQEQLWLDGDTLDDGFGSLGGYVCDVGFGAVGIHDITDPACMSAWPVPARERLYFSPPGSGGPVRLRVLDASGRAIIDHQTTARYVETGHLSPGCYVLVVDGTSTRFIKE